MADRSRNSSRSSIHKNNTSKRNTKTDRRIKRKQRINQNKVKSMKLAVMMLIILLAFTGLGGRLYCLARDNIL